MDDKTNVVRRVRSCEKKVMNSNQTEICYIYPQHVPGSLSAVVTREILWNAVSVGSWLVYSPLRSISTVALVIVTVANILVLNLFPVSERFREPDAANRSKMQTVQGWQEACKISYKARSWGQRGPADILLRSAH